MNPGLSYVTTPHICVSTGCDFRVRKLNFLEIIITAYCSHSTPVIFLSKRQSISTYMLLGGGGHEKADVLGGCSLREPLANNGNTRQLV